MRNLACGVALGAILASVSLEARAQVIPPGQFVIAGIPVVCGPLPTVLAPGLNDVAANNGQAILINPGLFGQLPPVLQLYTYAHECGHANVGPDEVAADCWAIKTGRNQGWFPPQAFQLLMQYFQNNPGDFRHPTGPDRVRNMMFCYQSP